VQVGRAAMLARACCTSLPARFRRSLIPPARRFAWEPERRILRQNIELAARQNDIAHVTLSHAAETQQPQRRMWANRINLFAYYYLLPTLLINCYITALGERLVQGEAGLLREQGLSGEVTLEVVSFTRTVTLTLLLDQPASAAADIEDEERCGAGWPEVVKRPPRYMSFEVYERRLSWIERTGKALFDGGGIAAWLGLPDPNAKSPSHAGLLAEAAADPHRQFQASLTVPMLPMLYVTDLIFGRSKWELRCWVDKKGRVLFRSHIGWFQRYWITLQETETVVQDGPR
jgi:hypothetical protein